MKLFLKGTKCFTEKCPIERRNFVPGQHGKARRAKLVGYGVQLREKQKVRRNYFEKAAEMKGVTGENLLQLLERRLDNVLYRMGLGSSRSQARQVVLHGHVAVNGRKVNVPSFLVKPGDMVEIREGSKGHKGIQDSLQETGHRSAPQWLEVDSAALKGKVTALPRKDDIAMPISEQLIVELYSK